MTSALPPTPTDGVLRVDKPVGPTSQTAVTMVRKALGAAKAGHTGTLDPFATGLLLVCLGRATKLAGYLTGEDKEYEATMVLGSVTDTDDATGRVLEEASAARVSRDAVERALEGFRGPIQQVPPAYSAIQKDGERMYDRARKGKEVILDAREVTVHALTLGSFEAGERAIARLVMRVSKGTYVRSLARDLGRVLGPGAHLAALRRTASGAQRVEDALPLESVRQDPQGARERIVPIDRVPLPMLDLVTTPEETAKLAHGVAPVESAQKDAGPAGLRRLVSPDGRALAIAMLSETGHLRLERVL